MRRGKIHWSVTSVALWDWLFVSISH